MGGFAKTSHKWLEVFLVTVESRVRRLAKKAVSGQDYCGH